MSKSISSKQIKPAVKSNKTTITKAESKAALAVQAPSLPPVKLSMTSFSLGGVSIPVQTLERYIEDGMQWARMEDVAGLPFWIVKGWNNSESGKIYFRCHFIETEGLAEKLGAKEITSETAVHISLPENEARMGWLIQVQERCGKDSKAPISGAIGPVVLIPTPTKNGTYFDMVPVDGDGQTVDGQVISDDDLPI